MASEVFIPRTQLDFGVPKQNMYQTYQQGPIHKSPVGNMEGIVPRRSQYHQNQLQFNLDSQSDPANLATKFLKPGAIIVEKLGSPQKKDSKPRFSQPVNFSVVSEDKLSLAMRLAKRDLKKKLLGQGFTIAQYPETEIPKKTKVTYSKEYKQKLKQRKEREKMKSAGVRIEERYRQSDVKTSETQTPRSKVKDRHLKASKGKGLAPEGTVLVHMKDPRRGEMMLQTGDADSPATKQAKEIRRLRKELRFYIDRIEDLSRREKSDQEQKLRFEDLDDEEDPRRKARELEQAGRNARLLYALQQQVRNIQDDLDKAGPDSITHTKKSHTLHKLAAAHRGAVRALQTFIHHMPNEPNSQSGLHRVYTELSTLIKQLSMVCAQLEIGESGVPDMVLKMPSVQREHELFSRQLRSPPRKKELLYSPGDTRQHTRRQLLGDFHSDFDEKPTRELWEGRNQWLQEKARDAKKKKKKSQRSKSAPVVQEIVPSRGEKPGQRTVERLRQSVRQRASSMDSPDRDVALRAGIAALLRAAKDSERRPPPQPRTTQPKQATSQTRRPPQTTKPVPLFPPQPNKTSLLLPSKLKGQRKKVAKVTVPEIDYPRFAESTVASQLKIQPVHIEPKPSYDKKPVWSPPGSPDSKKRLAAGVGEMSLLGDLEMTPRIRSPRHAWTERDLIRPHYRQGDGTKLSATEQAIKSKLQPLLDQAEEIADKYRELQRSTQQSLRYKLSERSAEHATANAELLSEMILEDVLTDTAKEFQRIENEKDMDRRVIAIQDAPTVENLLQRIELMETEEDMIRHRWNRVEYRDAERPSSLRSSQRCQEPTRDFTSQPQPIHITSLRNRDAVVIGTDDEDILDVAPADGEEIERTGMNGIPHYTSMQYSRAGVDPVRQPGGMIQRTATGAVSVGDGDRDRVRVFLPQETMQNIRDYRDKFDQHLKRTSTQAYGNFDPWKLVGDLADEIVDELMGTVALELDDVVDSYVEDIYKTEFTGERK